MAQGWSTGRVTGHYREDYVNNSANAVFAKYSDVYREAQASLGASSNTDDDYLSRIRKGKGTT